ncbi:MAG: amino acid ABC transporter permease [Alphaproteobacteria bacterium]|nr:amino acid ABC transporter permease [Alphaproteobacteria bacterium]MBO6629084.1 amino acid ABC transporter permease [Alphaproteobacteria bacterium]MDF1624913.1 amino acid ABC transporter permease [Parvibaculaceae bacterium]
MSLLKEPSRRLASVNPLNNPKVRSVLVQALVLLAVVALFWMVIDNTVHNLQRQNVATGFGFLDKPAGFGIVFSLVEYSEQSTYGRALLVGFLNTLLVAVIGIVVATVLGLTLGVARLSSNWLIAKLATIYIETLRNIPLLLQIFFWYFAVLRTLPGPADSLTFLDILFINNRGFSVPSFSFGGGRGDVLAAFGLGLVLALFGHVYAKRLRRSGMRVPALLKLRALLPLLLPVMVFFALGLPLHVDWPVLNRFGYEGGWALIPEFVALVLALSTYTAAFIAENVRSGIQAVSHGQTEAARALGLREGKILRLVIVPQALRIIIPPLTSQYLNLTKNSSLAVAIAYPDLVSVFSGTVLNQTGQAVEVIAITMTIYLSLSLFTSLLMNLYNRRMALVER